MAQRLKALAMQTQGPEFKSPEPVWVLAISALLSGSRRAETGRSLGSHPDSLAYASQARDPASNKVRREDWSQALPLASTHVTCASVPLYIHAHACNLCVREKETQLTLCDIYFFKLSARRMRKPTCHAIVKEN